MVNHSYDQFQVTVSELTGGVFQDISVVYTFSGNGAHQTMGCAPWGSVLVSQSWDIVDVYGVLQWVPGALTPTYMYPEASW